MFWVSQGVAQPGISIFPKIVEQDVSIDLSNFEKEIVLICRIINTDSKPVTLTWEEDFIDQPFEWQSDISDKYYYYFLYQGEKLKKEDVPPIDLEPEESFDLTLYVYPRGRAGGGSFFFNILTPQDSVLQHVSFYLAVKDRKQNLKTSNTFKTFPNPAEGYFELNPNDEIKQINLYNSIGQKVETYDYEALKKYDVSRLPNGLYLIEFISREGKILKTKRMIVKNPRA